MNVKPMTAVVALDDRFLYIACSMIVMALVAVAEWDALALDARDRSILGPLPIPRGVIIRAKLAAPWVRTANLRH